MEVIVIIPTRRPPPVLTLESYPPAPGQEVLLLADPDFYEAHKAHYAGSSIQVAKGVRGLGPQLHLAYGVAFTFGFRWWAKFDDDLPKGTFLHKEDFEPDLELLVLTLKACVVQTNTTHAGFANGANRYWMSEGYKRTYGLIHGGANIACSAADPDRFIDSRLHRGGDVYRTCAHRELDGAVGRVAFIGFDKGKSTVTAGQTSVTATQEEIYFSRDLILQRFPDMVTCEGTRLIDGGAKEIMNWRMRKGKGHRA
jgi:hypothetical protein